jgi:polyisoprenoid-binding protein YceI
MKDVKKRFCAIFLFFGAIFYSAAVELGSPNVCFEATGKPSFIKIEGEGKKLIHTEKKENEKTFDVFEFELADLSTGIDMRDEHMKEKYLQVKQFPKATLSFVMGEKPLLDFTGEKELTGTLTLHGQTKPVVVKAKKDGKNVEGAFEIKLSDFGIQIPEWSGITVADTVKVRANFEAVLQAPVLAR